MVRVHRKHAMVHNGTTAQQCHCGVFLKKHDRTGRIEKVTFRAQGTADGTAKWYRQTFLKEKTLKTRDVRILHQKNCKFCMRHL